MKDRPPLSLIRCKATGHMRHQCTVANCDKCAKFGHTADSCGANMESFAAKVRGPQMTDTGHTAVEQADLLAEDMQAEEGPQLEPRSGTSNAPTATNDTPVLTSAHLSDEASQGRNKTIQGS
jgi:hypothetical protein